MNENILRQDEIDALPLMSSGMLGDRLRDQLISPFYAFFYIKPYFEEFLRRAQEWERLQKENDDLRLQLQAAREQLNSTPQWVVGVDPACPKCDDSIIEVNDGNRVVARIKLGSDALEPDAPDGEMKYWFNIATGPYRALDIQAERDFSWSRGPFGSYREADQEWKAYIKRQNANGQP